MCCSWQEPKAKKEMDKAKQYVVYRFSPKEKIDTDKPENIVAITRDCKYILNDDDQGCTFVITALDRLQNESKGVKIKI